MLLCELSFMLLWFEVVFQFWLDWRWLPELELIVLPSGERSVSFSWLCLGIDWIFDPLWPELDLGPEEEKE